MQMILMIHNNTNNEHNNDNDNNNIILIIIVIIDNSMPGPGPQSRVHRRGARRGGLGAGAARPLNY